MEGGIVVYCDDLLPSEIGCERSHPDDPEIPDRLFDHWNGAGGLDDGECGVECEHFDHWHP